MGKLAFLVGCCYLNTEDALKGCYNDVDAMQDLLINRFGFHRNDVIVLTDMPNSPLKPTGYLGRPLLQTIVPSDFNLIYSDDFRYMVNNMPQGADFVMIADSCNSGGLIDQSKEQVGPGFRPDVCYPTRPCNEVWGKVKMIPMTSIVQHLRPLSHINSSDIRTLLTNIYGTNASIMFQGPLNPQLLNSFMVDGGILISACQSNEASIDDQKDIRPHGVFTDALYYSLRYQPGPITYKSLVEIIRAQLTSQRPCLYCSDQHASAPFLRHIPNVFSRLLM
nr:metacaspase-9-like [Coffea arabica]